MIKPDFADLRRKRDEAINKMIDTICAERGWARSGVRAHMSPTGCYCACPDGPCEHQFDGWREITCDDDVTVCGGEQVCRLCGMGAMSHGLKTAE